MRRLSAISVVTFLCLWSCGLRRASDFRVIPQSPEYLLRSPDARERPFSEILRQYNGFVRGQNGMDLEPGMELRIENAYYQAGMPRRGLNGFLGTEVGRYILTPNHGLDLLSVQSMAGRPASDLPVEKLMPASKQRFRYYRYYFEIVFKTNSVNRGSVLLGADSGDALRQLADLLAEKPDDVCGEKAEHCIVFPEACSVSVEMEVTVNGSRTNVVWGSELSSVVHNPKGLKLRRRYAGRLAAVRLGR